MTHRGVRLTIEGLSKRFGEKSALNEVNLSVKPGSFLVLLGPSGSGKTTLLRCLAGIERPTGGSVSMDGRVVVDSTTFLPPEKRDLAMVFQDYALWPHMTVAKNVGFALHRTSIPRAEGETRVGDILEKVGLADHANRYPNELSGGEQQRVALARALVAEVGLILFDEPLSNLDADRREALRIEIATLTRESGATCVYITHDQAESFALADRIGVLNHGSLVQFGQPEEIYQAPATAFVARFTGIAGEFSAVLDEQHTPERVVVRLDSLPGQPRVEARCPHPLTGAASLRLFVRAAAVTMSDTTGHVLGGTIHDVAYNGRGYEHVVALADGTQLTKVFSEHKYPRSTAVGLSFNPEFCIALAVEETL